MRALANRRRGVSAIFRDLPLRGRHLLFFDVLATVVSFVASFALRFDWPAAQFDLYLAAFRWFLPVLILVRIGTFLALRMYQRVWRYASIEELVAVVVGVSVSSAIAYGLLFLSDTLISVISLPGLPRSILIIDTVLMVALAGGWRFSARVVGLRRMGEQGDPTAERALVVGDGAAGIAVLREVRHNPSLHLRIVGLVADDLPVGQQLMGARVLGPAAELGHVVRRHEVAVVLLALPGANGKALRALVAAAEASGARCLTVPSLAEVAAGRVTMNTLREIDVEDLLRRAPARIDQDSVAAEFRDRTVLITGAGGSIGGELARQILGFRPRSLMLLGRGENSVFETIGSLPKHPDTEVIPVILDIREAARLDFLVGSARPDVIFHAAAHKHVGLMELYPEEAMSTNVIGTANVLEAAVHHSVAKVIFISTDKAVNPSSVMGATKRVGELMVSAAARRTGARYSAVRFGNVLSSRGSVVPIFRRQLAGGGPLTVTHPDVTRYFMTIPEAVQLVLQAALLAEASATFVLDMGEPVRITDLATELAELEGFEIGRDVDIEFVGLGLGEKLAEELCFAHERLMPTDHEAILRVNNSWPPPEGLAGELLRVPELIKASSRDEIRAWLKRIVPEYQPAEGSHAGGAP
jgi:FlaA1/EpsC-like NDP-sugar epimerase